MSRSSRVLCRSDLEPRVELREWHEQSRALRRRRFWELAFDVAACTLAVVLAIALVEW